MNGYVLIFIVIALIVGVLLGITTRFFNNFGANIARNRLDEMGVDLPQLPEDETDERLR